MTVATIGTEADLKAHYAAIRKRLYSPPKPVSVPAVVTIEPPSLEPDDDADKPIVIEPVFGPLQIDNAMPVPIPVPVPVDITNDQLADVRYRYATTRITIRMVIEAVEVVFGVAASDIRSARRHRHLMPARFCAASLACHLCEHATLPQVGKALGRDHTTILHAIRRWEKMIRDDAEMLDRETRVRRLINHWTVPE